MRGAAFDSERKYRCLFGGGSVFDGDLGAPDPVAQGGARSTEAQVVSSSALTCLTPEWPAGAGASARFRVLSDQGPAAGLPLLFQFVAPEVPPRILTPETLCLKP